jgi:hypothetical protein
MRSLELSITYAARVPKCPAVAAKNFCGERLLSLPQSFIPVDDALASKSAAVDLGSRQSTSTHFTRCAIRPEMKCTLRDRAIEKEIGKLQKAVSAQLEATIGV